MLHILPYDVSPISRSSHSFVRLHLGQGLNWILRQPWWTFLTSNNNVLQTGEHTVSPIIIDYICRPLSCQNFCWYLYLENFEQRVPLPDNRNDQWPVEGYGSAHQGYPKQGVRRYSQHPSSPFYAPRIVTIIGPRLPNRDTLATSKQARALYGLMILVLFSPFRDVNDLAQPFHDTDEESKYWLAYQSIENDILHDPLVAYIIDNMQDYHVMQAAAKTKRQQMREEQQQSAEQSTNDQPYDHNDAESFLANLPGIIFLYFPPPRKTIISTYIRNAN